MPKKRLSNKIPRKPKAEPSFDYEDDAFLSRVEALAFEGFYNTEIADELQISRYELEMAISQCEKLRNTLASARARARKAGAEMPSPAMFAKVWVECKGKRTALMKHFGIGWTKFQSWLAQEPMFVDIMAERELEFLEQLDIAGRILALGGVKGKDEFKGWNRYPSEWMMRFYLNTTGRKYGYGENPIVRKEEDLDGIPTDIEQGVDIESWIKKEMSIRKKDSEETDNCEDEE